MKELRLFFRLRICITVSGYILVNMQAVFCRSISACCNEFR